MLTLILGAMRSGKSKSLYTQALESKNAVFIRPKADTRPFISRAIKELSPKLVIKDENSDMSVFSSIFVDEIHLCADSTITKLTTLCRDRLIVCAGLNGDIHQRPFPQVSRLIPYADSVVLLHAVCEECGECGAKYSIGDGRIGDNYRVLCHNCLFQTS